MTDAIPTQPGSIVAGRYRVDRVVGVGSMSIVVAATHLEIERVVAIKFLNPMSVRPDSIERFRREAQNAARLKNEHVVRVIDIGSLAEGMPFIVMDLVEGRSLREELSTRGPLSVSEAVGIVLQAIEALAEAHAMGIVHRDLKPANLFLAECADRSHTVKVLDFGVSKSLADSHREGPVSLTRTGMVVGSPLYMPPEQLRSSRNADHRADIWALGAVLYELVTGHVPFDAKSFPELCTLVVGEPPPTSRHRSNIPPEFEAVIRRCLASDREARFQSVSELAAALAPFAPAESRELAAPSTLLGISESTPAFGTGAPKGTTGDASSGKTRGLVVLGVSLAALLAGGTLYFVAGNSETPSDRALGAKVAKTSAAAAAAIRSAEPIVTPVENGSVLERVESPSVPVSAALANSAAPATSVSAAPPAVHLPISLSGHYQPRFPAPLPPATASSVPESTITDFGGRK